MGVVYEAVQLGLNRHVAIKRVRRGALATERDLLRFRGEAEVIATLDHPNIVPIHEIGEHEGEHYYCMKFFEGKDLRERLADFRGRPREVARLVATIADAVQYAHQRGILHRDLKPSNVLLDSDGAPHLVDFGLAVRTDRDGGAAPRGVVGTPHYMAPEQAVPDGRVTTLSDVYGLGGILYSLLTGAPPFEVKSSSEEMLRTVIEEAPIRPLERDPAVDRDLEVICLNCLAKDPLLRYATAKEVADDLRRWLDGVPIQARPHTRVERVVKWARRKPTTAALWAALITTAALGLVGIVAALLLAMYNERLAIARAEEARRQAYLATIRTAMRDYRDANIGPLRQALDATKPRDGQADLRGFEWHYLDDLCHQDRYTRKASHESLRRLAIHPDGSRLVVVGDDVRGQLRDGATGALLRSLTTGDQRGRDVAFHPDGRTFAISAANGELCLYDAETFQEVRSFAGLIDTAWRAVIGPDGRWLAAAGEHGQALVWDLASGALLHDLKGHPATAIISGLAGDRDGRWLASTADDRTIKIWDVRTGRLVKEIDALEGLPRALDFSNDGTMLAVGVGGKVVILSTADWSRAREFRGELSNDLVLGLDFNAAGTLIATGGFDQVVRVWNADTGALVRSYRGHTNSITDVRFHPTLPLLIAVDEAGELKSWGLDDEQDARELTAHEGPVHDVRFGPSGTWFASSGRDEKVLLWDTQTGKFTGTIEGHRGAVRQLSISPDGNHLASVGEDRTLRVFEVATRKAVHQAVEADVLWCVAYAPSGKWLAYAGDGQVVKLWDLARDRVLTLDGHRGSVRCIAFSPDGKRLVATGRDTHVLVWDLPSGRRVGPEFAGDRDETMYNAIEFSPDGHRLAAAGRGRAIRIWDARTGRLVHVLRGHKDTIRDLAFSPDGRRLASSGTDCLRLWELETGRELLAFEPYDSYGTAVAFSPDGGWLLSAGVDGVIWARGLKTRP
jgi:WD40 repeat protein